LLEAAVRTEYLASDGNLLGVVWQRKHLVGIAISVPVPKEAGWQCGAAREPYARKAQVVIPPLGDYGRESQSCSDVQRNMKNGSLSARR
jgi:hypothetical protein